jgi:hypothetical protein
MKYALNLADDGRILSVTLEEYAPLNAVIVDCIPEGDVTKFRYVDGEYIDDPIEESMQDVKLQRIYELKQLLAATDYNILKIVEGAATLDDMSEIIAQRSKWRAEINELEKELG